MKSNGSSGRLIHKMHGAFESNGSEVVETTQITHSYKSKNELKNSRANLIRRNEVRGSSLITPCELLKIK